MTGRADNQWFLQGHGLRDDVAGYVVGTEINDHVTLGQACHQVVAGIGGGRDGYTHFFGETGNGLAHATARTN